MLTLIPLIFKSAPEVSICPPLPSIPLASNVPLTVVSEFEFFISDHATIVPPEPLVKAFAVILEFESIFRYVA